MPGTPNFAGATPCALSLRLRAGTDSPENAIKAAEGASQTGDTERAKELACQAARDSGSDAAVVACATHMARGGQLPEALDVISNVPFSYFARMYLLFKYTSEIVEQCHIYIAFSNSVCAAKVRQKWGKPSLKKGKNIVFLRQFPKHHGLFRSFINFVFFYKFVKKYIFSTKFSCFLGNEIHEEAMYNLKILILCVFFFIPVISIGIYSLARKQWIR